MKQYSILFWLFLMSAGLLSSCCNSITKKYKELKEEHYALSQKYRNLYRNYFELTEYSQMTKYQKWGYKWTLSHIWESSGDITDERRKWIKKNYGKEAVKEWDKGRGIGWEVFMGEHKLKKLKKFQPFASPNSDTAPAGSE